MAWRSLRWFLLAACVVMQAGCASDEHRSADDTASPDYLEPVPSHDDSHGWGTNVQAGGH